MEIKKLLKNKNNFYMEILKLEKIIIQNKLNIWKI